MTRRSICIAAFAAWVCAAPTLSSAQSRSSQRDALHLRVLAVHDFHGALRPSAYPWSRGRLVGGMAALKSLLDSAAMRCGCVTTRLDGGDQMQGTLDSNLSHGAAVVRGADVAIYNPGGIRSGLPSGIVNYAQLYRVLPFGNMLYRLTLTGAQLRAVVEQGVSGVEGGPFHFSGISVLYDIDAPPGRRVIAIVRADRSPIDDRATYTLAIADHLAEGGSGFAMLTEIQPARVSVSTLDALIAYLQRLPQPVAAPADIRGIAVQRH